MDHKKLNFELISKEAQLKFYYERHYKLIADFQNSLDFDQYSLKLLDNFGKRYKYNENNTIYISPLYP